MIGLSSAAARRCSALMQLSNLHLLGELREPSLGLFRRQTPPVLEHREVELEDALRADPERRFGVAIGDLEMASKVLLPAWLAGLDRRFVIDGTLGECPLTERGWQRAGDRQWQNAVPDPLRVT